VNDAYSAPNRGPLPGRNLALELVRLTEAAALAASRWVGRGDKNAADGAAVDAMRSLISAVAMNGVVVIGEGEKDNAPMLFNGERVGDGTGPEVDVAVDPIDGTTLTGNGQNNALSVLAAANRGAMYDPSAVFYMDKLATGPEGVGVVDIRQPIGDNIRALARAKSEQPADLTVVVLARPRHDHLVADIRASGARIKFIPDGDVAGAVMAAQPETSVDLMVGVGGTPEGVIAACAIKCLGGFSKGGCIRAIRTRCEGRWTPATTLPGCLMRTIWWRATRSLPQRASRMESCYAGCVSSPAVRRRRPWSCVQKAARYVASKRGIG